MEEFKTAQLICGKTEGKSPGKWLLESYPHGCATAACGAPSLFDAGTQVQRGAGTLLPGSLYHLVLTLQLQARQRGQGSGPVGTATWTAGAGDNLEMMLPNFNDEETFQFI